MEKLIVYPGATPLDTDILSPQRYTEIALGMLARMTVGITPVIDGLAVLPQAVPNMTVQVGPGMILTQTVIDPTGVGFGSLAPDTSTNLVKLGINTQPVTMAALTAPVTAGQSQNWLVEAQFLEQDGVPIVLPYYDAANPALPYTGPANAGTTQNTVRHNSVQLQLKGGVAAATGQQSTPVPDAGWVGVAIVTVANGQVSILSANITPYSSAPFVPTKLSVQRTRLFAPLNLYLSPFGSDTANSGLSAASPFLTMQKAWNTLVGNYDLNGQNVTVNLANGTYTAGLIAAGSIPGMGSGNSLTFKGNVTTPSSVLITTSNASCIGAANQSAISVQGMRFLATGTDIFFGSIQACALTAIGGSTIAITGPVEFGAVAGDHMLAGAGSTISATGASYTITGGALSHAASGGGGGTIAISGATITLSGTPAFSTGFANSFAAGYVYFITTTITGSATGPRYQAALGGIINTQGAGATYLPGATSGTTATGGQYA